MRTNTTAYNDLAQAKQRELRLVVTMEYSGTTYYFTSHDDIATPGASSIHASLIKTNAKTQRYIPEQARSEIGRLTFSLLDVGEAISDLLNDEQFNNDEGPRGREATLYRGFKDLDWADFRKEVTQLVDGNINYQDGAYDFTCSDKLSSLKADIFDFPSTRLSAAATATDSTLTVYTTTDFDLVPQGTSYSYGPSSSLIMLRIKYENTYEICSATGKTATTFTGVTRGLFGTTARSHDLPDDPNDDNGVEVEYYPYIELPVAKLIYALLTGVLLNQGGATLPAAYHRGIPEADIDSASFENYPDWYDTSDDTKGLILRFQGGAMSKTDGKAFIEKECLSLINAFLLVDSDGKLSLRRKVTTLADSDYVDTLDASMIVKHGKLTHDTDGVAGKITVNWAYREFTPNDKGFYRTRTLSDSISLARFPNSKTRELSFKGLHPARHTTTILQGIFASLRDSVAAPPLYLSGVSVMPSFGFDIEVGDVLRVDLSTLRDYQSLVDVSELDRPFEVRRVTIDQVKDSVVVDFVGSSTPGSILSDSDGGTNVIPDAKYTSTGTNLTSVLSIDGSGFTTASGTLTGGTTTRTRFYYDGDLTITAGHVIDFTGNIEIWVKGHLSVLGSITGKGGGNGLAAALGNTRAQGAASLASDLETVTFSLGAARVGQFQTIPPLLIENDAGDLSGIPADLRGSGGATGSQSIDRDLEPTPPPIGINGGAGGAGGGSIVIVARGFSFGPSGSIDVSGDDGSLGSIGTFVTGGSGAGGSAGGAVILIDGSANSVPIVAGKIIANRGDSPTPAGHVAPRTQQRNFATLGGDPWSGWLGLPAGSQFGSNVRVQYVPVSRTAYDDAPAGSEIVSGVTATGVEGGILFKWTNPSDPEAWDLVEIWTNTANTQTGFAKVYEGRSNEYFLKTDDTVQRYAWFRSRSGVLFSSYLPATDTTTYTATPSGITAASVNWSGVVDDGNRPTDNADVTSANTAGDTAAVNGVAATTVQSGAALGTTSSQATGVANNADVTASNTAADTATVNGVAATTVQTGAALGTTSSQATGVANNADVTSANTAADTASVNGVAATTVQSGAALGTTSSQATGVADNADVTASNTSADTTTVNGVAATTVQSGAALGATSSQATGVANNADVTASNTSADTTTVNGVAATTVQTGAALGATSSQATGVEDNADVTASNTAADTATVNGVAATTVQTGAAAGATASQATGVANNADVTASNTAADTSAVNGVAATTVQTGAAAGATASQATGVANNADVTSANTAADTATVNGVAATTVQTGAALGATASQATGVEDDADVNRPEQAGFTAGNLLFNGDTAMVDANGRPAGIRVSNLDGGEAGGISYVDSNKNSMRVDGDQDSYGAGIAITFPAIRSNRNSTYAIRLRVKGEVNNGQGFDVEMHQHSSELGAGVQYVSEHYSRFDTPAIVQEPDLATVRLDEVGVTTSYVELIYFFTPHPNCTWFGLNLTYHGGYWGNYIDLYEARMQELPSQFAGANFCVDPFLVFSDERGQQAYWDKGISNTGWYDLDSTGAEKGGPALHWDSAYNSTGDAQDLNQIHVVPGHPDQVLNISLKVFFSSDYDGDFSYGAILFDKNYSEIGSSPNFNTIVNASLTKNSWYTITATLTLTDTVFAWIAPLFRANNATDGEFWIESIDYT